MNVAHDTRGRREGWQTWLAATWGRATDLNLRGRADYTFLSASYTPTGNTALEKNSQCNFGFTLLTSGDIFFSRRANVVISTPPSPPPPPWPSFFPPPTLTVSSRELSMQYIMAVRREEKTGRMLAERKFSFRASVGADLPRESDAA